MSPVAVVDSAEDLVREVYADLASFLFSGGWVGLETGLGWGVLTSA
jgi:hypothetical protein